MTSSPLPSPSTPVERQGPDGGFQGIAQEWYRYWQSLSDLPGAAVQPAVGASPWTYSPPNAGTVLVSGGTVSSIKFVRGRVTITTGLTSGMFPVGLGDSLIITYTVLPTVWFLPS